jgi:alkanesulfonate monooxygenase SsuD/methylene tetrahydromethanopterin reductase-like flavin-dependent oxidoreductase (luciferase family)
MAPPIRLQRLSILDFHTPAGAIKLAPMAEEMGYHRYWLGEHHSPRQCANPLLLGAVLTGLTTSIRVGSGGACLNCTNAFRLAEDARLVSYLFPDRFDLGLAAGLGYPPALAAVLTDRAAGVASGSFAERAAAVHQYVTGRLPADHPLAATPLHLEPGPPVWILGTSAASARLAAGLGTGLCVSLHHSRDEDGARAAIAEYRAAFAPSPEFPAPAAIVVISGICAETSADAAAIAAALSRHGGGSASTLTDGASFVGDAASCADRLTKLAERLATEELMILDFIGKPWRKRVRMYELLQETLRLAPPKEAPPAPSAPALSALGH